MRGRAKLFPSAAILVAVVLLAILGVRGEAQVRAALVQLVNPPLAPTKPSDMVTLRSSGSVCTGSPWRRLDRRVNPDGTVTPYTIPAGQVLVVTSVDWRQGFIAAGGHSEFFLFPSEANISVNYPIAQSVGAGAGPTGGGSFLVTGVALPAGTPCWGINDLTNLGSADALVHGFLAADQ
jgi:hypothetical protein